MADFVRNLIAGLSERERRLILFMGFVFAALVIVLFVYFVQSGISDLRGDNQKYTKALRIVASEEENYLAAQLENQRSQSKGKVLLTPLRTLVDKIGRQLNVDVPDIKELPEQRVGGQWTEHSIELSMREIGIENLTKFMEEVEGNRRKFPIAITKLEIRARKRTDDSYDIKMVVATFEQMQPEPEAAKKRTSGASRKGGL
jgi:hypothetical protein